VRIDLHAEAPGAATFAVVPQPAPCRHAVMPSRRHAVTPSRHHTCYGDLRGGVRPMGESARRSRDSAANRLGARFWAVIVASATAAAMVLVGVAGGGGVDGMVGELGGRGGGAPGAADDVDGEMTW